MTRNWKGLFVTWAVVATTVGAQQRSQAPDSMKGAVLKGRAPVSDEVLRVKLPRPKEVDLSNGIHLMVLEDHRAPTVSFQILIQGAGGYYDPPDVAGLADLTATLMREGT